MAKKRKIKKKPESGKIEDASLDVAGGLSVGGPTAYSSYVNQQQMIAQLEQELQQAESAGFLPNSYNNDSFSPAGSTSNAMALLSPSSPPSTKSKKADAKNKKDDTGSQVAQQYIDSEEKGSAGSQVAQQYIAFLNKGSG